MFNFATKHFTRKVSAAAACFIVAATGGFSPAAAQEINLRYGDHVPTVHYASTDGAVRWFKRVGELTNGKVKFTYFPAQQAAKAPQMLDAVRGGILDCAYVGAIYTGERLPLNTVFGLPGFIRDAVSGSTAYQQLLMKDSPFREEWLKNGVTPVWGFLQPPNQAFKRGGPIKSIDDWKGLKVRVSGESVSMAVKLLGGVPVRFPAPEMYTGMQRGTLDVTLLPFATAKGFRINEVSQSASTNMSLGSWNVTIVCDTKKWQSLPEGVRAAMLQAGDETAKHLARLYEDVAGELVKKWGKDGLQTFKASPEMLARMNEILKPVAQEWVDRLTPMAPRAAQALELYRTMTAAK